MFQMWQDNAGHHKKHLQMWWFYVCDKYILHTEGKSKQNSKGGKINGLFNWCLYPMGYHRAYYHGFYQGINKRINILKRVHPSGCAFFSVLIYCQE